MAWGSDVGGSHAFTWETRAENITENIMDMLRATLFRRSSCTAIYRRALTGTAEQGAHDSMQRTAGAHVAQSLYNRAKRNAVWLVKQLDSHLCVLPASSSEWPGSEGTHAAALSH